MSSGRNPIIVGIGQVVQRWRGPTHQKDPVALMEVAARAALADACARQPPSRTIDAVHVVNVLSWSYADAPQLLASRLNLHPAHRTYSAIGGNTPQSLVNQSARDLEEGAVRCVLLAGAEAAASVKRAAAEGVDLGWPQRAEPAYIHGEQRLGFSALELEYGLALPVYMYALLETACRAGTGHSPAEHHAYLGQLCAAMSRVGATHPYSWFPEASTAEQVTTVGPDNRWVGYPYTKRMCAILDVDQAAALLMTTEAVAVELGIDPARWVYPMGGADLHDIWHVSQRPRLDESPAIREAAISALAHAGIALEEVQAFDLYSCFPCAVQIGRSMVGIPEQDPRPLTVTGGLPYFGGPGNNYSMHAIATVVDRIRAASVETAMITSLGWYSTKHAVGLYGRRPPVRAWGSVDEVQRQTSIDARALPEPVREASGSFTIEAFVIRYQRDGSPRDGVCLGRTAAGRRALALLEADPAELEALEREELVGRVGQCRYDATAERNRLRLR